MTESTNVTKNKDNTFTYKVVHNKKDLSCIIKADFETLKRGYSKITQLDKDGNIVPDMIGAGEQLLMFGWVSGDDIIREDPFLKMSACMAFSSVLTEFPIGDVKKN